MLSCTCMIVCLVNRSEHHHFLRSLLEQLSLTEVNNGFVTPGTNTWGVSAEWAGQPADTFLNWKSHHYGLLLHMEKALMEVWFHHNANEQNFFPAMTNEA